jgi:hypothetical protein
MIEVKRSVELEQHVREVQEAVRAGDDQWFADHTAEGGEILFYGTAPDEEWRGRDAVLSLTVGESRAQMDAANISEQEDPTVECFEAGDTGWTVLHGHFNLADGSVVPVRAVTIYVRDGDMWKRVFGAVHVLASNDLLTPGSPLASQPT